MAHTHIVRGISDTHHPSTRRSHHSHTRDQYEENLEMEDIIYCISTKEFIFFWAIAALNMLSLLVMCYVTRRQCVRGGFLA